MENVYYLSIGSTIAFNLYIIVMATVTTIRAQRMALHGHVETAMLEAELPHNLGFQPGVIEGATAPELPAMARMDSAKAQSQDDVQRAIVAMRAMQPSIMVAWGLSLITFTSGAIAMVWIKTEPMHFVRTGHPNNRIAIYLSSLFILLLLVIVCANCWISSLFDIRQYHDANLRSTFSFRTSPKPSGLPMDLEQPLVSRGPS